MLCSLLAIRSSDGQVLGTLDSLNVTGPDGRAVEIDFSAIEAAGAPFRLRADNSEGVWMVPGADASGTWPEWLGLAASDFRAETVGVGRALRIVALVHVGHGAWRDETGVLHPAVPGSGHRRVRADIEAAIEGRIEARRAEAVKHAVRFRDARGVDVPVRAVPEPADITDIVGAPFAPLELDDTGRTTARPARATASHLADYGLWIDAPDVEQQQAIDGGDASERDAGNESLLRAVPVGQPG